MYPCAGGEAADRPLRTSWCLVFREGAPPRRRKGDCVAEDLSAWIGKEEQVHDVITAWPIVALRATLDLPEVDVGPGTALPPLWHWLYFLPTTTRSSLGPDGHAKRGGFLPPVTLPRRMYAGGRFDFRDPLRVGDEAIRTSRIVDVAEKQGRSGRLVFVTVRHEIGAASGVALVEEQDLVYRDVPARRAVFEAGAEAPAAAAWERTFTPDEVLLFRFSALTFNGHRIHYDHPFVTGEEGYPGLVVHGPLTALLLAELAQNGLGRRLRSFSFRGTAPLFCGEAVTLRGEPQGAGAVLAAWSHDNRLAMTAEADLA